MISLQKSPLSSLLSITVKEPSGSHIAQGGCFLKKRPLELLLDTDKQTFPVHMFLHALREKHYMLNMPHVVWYHLYFLSDFRAIPYTSLSKRQGKQ